TGFRTVQLREHTTAALAGLARLSAFVAHELKNPLGALKLYALLLERQCREARPELRELADKVARAIDQLSTVINEATGFGLPGAFEPAAVALVPLMDDALGSVEARAGDTGVQVVRRYEGAGVTARADARGLRQATVAFLTHALDAMPEGGTLTVGVGQRGPSEAELSVQDSGSGLAPEIRDRLFEPFFTTRGAGTGLEMLIASQIIEQHGGRIEVHSQPGGGTTIRVILPAAAQAEDNARRTHSGR
ncbi:MAG TPA: ATP-binding protein, partial [Methylomirabilota bacterium]|nr:ATP-binding protein [Methylomirabilota bacterium]